MPRCSRSQRLDRASPQGAWHQFRAVFGRAASVILFRKRPSASSASSGRPTSANASPSGRRKRGFLLSEYALPSSVTAPAASCAANSRSPSLPARSGLGFGVGRRGGFGLRKMPTGGKKKSTTCKDGQASLHGDFFARREAEQQEQIGDKVGCLPPGPDRPRFYKSLRRNQAHEISV